MKNRVARSSLVTVLFFVPLAAVAGEPQPIFDGRSLDGWKVERCEAEVQDGAILLKAGNGIVYPDRQYGDFVLELEWKALKPEEWDSGIFFRSELPTGERPWPQRWQVNLRQGHEGNVGELKQARTKGLVKDGEWNQFKLSVVGSKAALAINGKPAWQADGVEAKEGYIALQAEVPGGGQFLFRNIRVAEGGP